jgi:hypothetical protein
MWACKHDHDKGGDTTLHQRYHAPPCSPAPATPCAANSQRPQPTRPSQQHIHDSWSHGPAAIAPTSTTLCPTVKQCHKSYRRASKPPQNFLVAALDPGLLWTDTVQCPSICWSAMTGPTRCCQSILILDCCRWPASVGTLAARSIRASTVAWQDRLKCDPVPALSDRSRVRHFPDIAQKTRAMLACCPTALSTCRPSPR